MRFLSLTLLTGAALANPYADLGKRQLNSAQIASCSISHTAQCVRTLLSSASVFCASLGYGTTINTVSRTVNIRRTIATTLTVTTGTTTIMAPRVTNTVSTVRTTQITTTLTIESATTTTRLITEEATGTIEACPAYTPAQTAHNTEASGRVDTSSTTTTSSPSSTTTTQTSPTSHSSTTTSSSSSSSTTTSGSATPSCARLASPPSRFCGQPGAIGVDTRDTTITTLNTGYAIASLEGCALACSLNRGSSSNGRTGCQSIYFRQNSFCQLNVDNTNGTQWRNDASGSYSGADLSCFSCTGPGAQRQTTSSTTTTLTTTSTTTSSTTSSTITSTTTSSTPPLPQITNGNFDTCPGSNRTILEYEGGAHMQVLCGIELTEYTNFTTSPIDTLEKCMSTCIQTREDNCRGVQFWSAEGFPPACNFLGANAQGTFGFQQRSEVISVMRVKFYVNDPYPEPILREAASPMVRRVAEPLEVRQAAPIKPACLRAANAVQTKSACNCVIPRSTATLTSTITNTVTNMRTISTTRSILATVTQTPTITITNTRVSTLTRRRSTTRWTTEAITLRTTSTVSWHLAATPAAFYIVDSDMAFAEWPADADEIFYHVQYDWDQTDDEYAPTVFSLTGSNADELRVANIANEDGPTEGWRVVGQSYDGPGWQMMALEDSGGYAVPACRIEVTADGKCPLLCNLGMNDVNGRNDDGLWSLLPHGTEDGFDNFAMIAGDIELDQDESPPTSTRPASNATIPAMSSPPTAMPSTCNRLTSRANPTNKCDYNYQRDGFYNSRASVYTGTTKNLAACLDVCDTLNAGPDTGCAMGDFECATGSCKLYIQGGSGGRPVEGGATTFFKEWNSCTGSAQIRPRS